MCPEMYSQGVLVIISVGKIFGGGGGGRMRMPFARGSAGFVEVSISRLGDILAGNERRIKKLCKRWLCAVEV